jgi:hypothetical protein
MQIFEFIKKAPVLSSPIFKNQTPMVGFLKKCQNQRIAGSGYFTTLKELAVLMKSPVNNWWFYRWFFCSLKRKLSTTAIHRNWFFNV